MVRHQGRGVSRRAFLQTAGAVAGAAAAGALGACVSGGGTTPAGGEGLSLWIDPSDPIPAASQAQWALARFREALSRRGIATHINSDPETGFPIRISGISSPPAQQALAASNIKTPTAPESLVIALSLAHFPTLVAGNDPNGLAYALTELAQRVAYATNPWDALRFPTATDQRAIVESPANKTRSICRVFVSEDEDKPWYYDQKGWQQYFDMLAENRFNKFNLSLGLGYDFSTNVPDAYFFFAYPFFLKVPGYNVRAMARGGKPLSDDEQAKNLGTLQFISRQAAMRGIHFNLGLWTHSISWGGDPNYTLDGISSASQAPYSRDALRTLLEACPDITGVTIRTHGESGVPETVSNELWKTIFEGTRVSGGRKVEIDLHAKGITFELIDAARATGNPVIVTPKYWAEHMGLPYIQASIRDWELPKADTGGLMSRSTGTRNHMHYGYGDILTQDRQYGVVHRVFPGTQRFLLWGDPVFAREYGRNFSFNGSGGVEFFEPLSFKGRQGSGTAKNRSCYARTDWAPRWSDQMEKYEYTFCLWGRFTYKPDADAEVYRRILRRDYGSAADDVENSLGNASRILPLVTVAHSPSAAQANFWPELYSNMSHHDATTPTYGDDTPSPKVFGTVTSLDPQLFASVNECADALLAGKGIGKITVTEVADQLVKWSQIAGSQYDNDNLPTMVASRTSMDVQLAASMGQFWAAKFRTGLLYAIFEKSGHEPARQAALAEYEKARDEMAFAGKLAKGVYITDITFGARPVLRGQWIDRLAHIDKDLAGMRTATPSTPPTATPAAAAAALAKLLTKTARPTFGAKHAAARSFEPGKPLALELAVDAVRSAELSVRLWYRHVNQAEKYESVLMQGRGDGFVAAIPAEYSRSAYALQYFFELNFGAVATALYPGFREDFVGVPYFLVPQARGSK